MTTPPRERPHHARVAWRAVGALAAALLGLRATPADAQDRTALDTTVAVPPGATVEVHHLVGTIRVLGVPRDVARFRGSGRSGSVTVTAGGNTLFFARTARVRGEFRDGDNALDIEVPVGVRVVATSASGDIEIRDTRGEVEARSTSGDVVVTGARRRLAASSTSGDLTIRDADGTIQLSTASGDARLEDLNGAVELSAVSGTVIARGGRFTACRIETVAGDLDFGAAVIPGGRYELRTHSGDIRLRTAGQPPMHLAVETFSGDVRSNVPAIRLPDSDSRQQQARLELRVGDPDANAPRLVLTTFSGDIIVGSRGGSP